MSPGAALDFLTERAGVEVVFPVLHGPGGEDGSVQGMLELYDVPFVGAGCAASAVAMDKIRTRECLGAHGIPMPAVYLPSTPLDRADATDVAAAIEAGIGYPCFLKVDVSGSTLGVSRAAGPPEVAAFLAEARPLGRLRAPRARRLDGETGGLAVHLHDVLFHRVVGLGDARRPEGVGLDDVGAGGEVGVVHFAHDVGTGEHE